MSGSHRPEVDDAGRDDVSRVLIATASEVTRSWFAQMQRLDGLAIVGITRRDASLVMHVEALAPDVVVIDGTDGDVGVIASVLESVTDPTVGVILLLSDETWNSAPSDIVPLGARAVLSPQPTVEELEATVRAVKAGLIVLEPRMLTLRSLPPSELKDPLTPREIDVLNALAEGLGNKQVAARLAISEHTVKTHLAAIFEKLDASNRTEAVTAGARLGLILL